MNAQVVAIGTELLLGFQVNDDCAHVGRALAELGINCYRHVTVGDNPDRLSKALREALIKSDLVVTCGGLGPTVDDVTLETIAQVTRRPLKLNRAILRQIEHRFKTNRIRMPKNNVRQATLPQGAIPFANRIGTAPGFLLKLQDRPVKLLLALPGPPYELIPILERMTKELKRYAGKEVLRSKTLKVTGPTESQINDQVKDLLKLQGKTTLGIYASPGEIKLRITSKGSSATAAQRGIATLERKIRKRLGSVVFGVDEQTLEAVLGKLLQAKRKSLAVAESCTGGLVGHRVTEISGSSRYFKGGVVAYANQLKQSGLDVPENVLKKEGAVSAGVARAMAQGVRTLTGASLGLALTGIAGPTGGSKTKPVGLVFVALSSQKQTQVHRFHFTGTRSMVKFMASQAGLNLVRLHLSS